jgi:hypothetical protein
VHHCLCDCLMCLPFKIQLKLNTFSHHVPKSFANIFLPEVRFFRSYSLILIFLQLRLWWVRLYSPVHRVRRVGERDRARKFWIRFQFWKKNTRCKKVFSRFTFRIRVWLHISVFYLTTDKYFQYFRWFNK